MMDSADIQLVQGNCGGSHEDPGVPASRARRTVFYSAMTRGTGTLGRWRT